MTDYLLYPGCAIPSKLPFIEAAGRFVLERLGMKTEDFPDFTCCVEPVGLRSIGFETWIVAGGRLHAIASRKGLPVLTMCDGCTLSLTESGEMLESGCSEGVNAVLRELGLRYQAPAVVFGVLDLLHSNLSKMEEMAVHKVAMKLALHPGCHGEHLHADGEAKRMMAEIVTALGATVVSHADRFCCGGSLTSVNDTVAKGIGQETLLAYADSDAVLTSCPFCFLQFDTVVRAKPVMHLLEVVAIALGWDVDPLPFHRTRL